MANYYSLILRGSGGSYAVEQISHACKSHEMLQDLVDDDPFSLIRIDPQGDRLLHMVSFDIDEVKVYLAAEESPPRQLKLSRKALRVAPQPTLQTGTTLLVQCVHERGIVGHCKIDIVGPFNKDKLAIEYFDMTCFWPLNSKPISGLFYDGLKYNLEIDTDFGEVHTDPSRALVEIGSPGSISKCRWL